MIDITGGDLARLADRLVAGLVKAAEAAAPHTHRWGSLEQRMVNGEYRTVQECKTCGMVRTIGKED